VTCSSCGKELPGDFAFCPFCGAAQSSARAPTGREERKVVTVLFADLVGFTARSERMDPEDVRALLSPYHAHLRSELERFGGTVEKFIGDAVMAIFGAPVTHEDDAERAVRAALAIRDWASGQGEELRVRIGVNTGEALVALDARPEEGEGMAAGDVVNTAARLQTAAPLNGVLVGDHTHRATSQVIDYRPADPVEAKGKRDAVPVWEALEARSRFGIDTSEQATGPLVGRGREVELLVSTLARVREERSTQLVTLVGVPGIGKSRLVLELFQHVEEEPDLITWRQGRSLPYGEGVTFWALSEIIKAQAGILESDTEAQTKEKLARAVADVAADDSEARWLEGQLAPLAGVTDDRAARPDEGFAAWHRFLEAMADARPLVLVFEDLHWSDDALLDFVDQLPERAGGVPLLVVASARPELLERRPGWGGGKLNALTISLAPLSDDDTAGLVRSVLERPLLDARTLEALLHRAGGNPLFAEQYARILLEQGEVGSPPDTVQGIIAARLDGLPGPEKQLLQDAAVIGKVFWLGAVGAIGGTSPADAERLLQSLERKEFVQHVRRSSVAGQREYAFRHVLIRDVAYGQIPRPLRSEKHRRAAVWIESLGRAEDQAEMLAHHWLQALELAEAAGLDLRALRDPARRALRDAGDRAAALFAIDTAVRFYDAALRLWPEGSPERARLLLRRAAPVHITTGADPERLTEARDALLAARDTEGAGEAEMLLARSFWMQGRPDLFDEHAERGAALLEDAPPSRAKAAAYIERGSRALLAGDTATGVELVRRGYAAAEQLGWDGGQSEALGLLGTARMHEADPGALDDMARGLEIATAAGALGTVSRLHNNIAVAYQILGDLRLGYEARLEGLRVAERMGSASERRWFLGVLPDHLYRRGEWDDALRMADDFLAEVEGGSPHYTAYQVAGIRAEIRVGRGDRDGAIRDAESALAAVREVTEPQTLYFVLPTCAHVLTIAGQLDRARSLAHEYLEALRAGVNPQFAVICLPSFAAAARRLGLGQELAAALSTRTPSVWIEAVQAYLDEDFAGAADRLERIGELPESAEARIRDAEQLVARGHRAEADRRLQEPLSFYRSVGATAFLRECEALLAASA
jgi:predicted ATPase/class 3 adenylate cyclase